MSFDYDVDVDISCSCDECGKTLHDGDSTYCRGCSVAGDKVSDGAIAVRFHPDPDDLWSAIEWLERQELPTYLEPLFAACCRAMPSRSIEADSSGLSDRERKSWKCPASAVAGAQEQTQDQGEGARGESKP